MNVRLSPVAGSEDECRLIAELHAGIADADADRPVEAERRFRHVLEQTRGSGTHVERFACSCLVKIFARQNRDVEALVLARRHVVMAQALRSAEAVCLAYAGLGDAFARIESWDRLGETIERLEAALGAYDGRFARGLHGCLLRLRAEWAMAHGDWQAAAAEMERLAALGVDPAEEPEHERATLLFQADIALRAGRAADARAYLDRCVASRAPSGVDALDTEYLAVRCALALEGPVAAALATSQMLDRLDCPSAAMHGTGARIRFARLLGDLAASECGDARLATRAYDVAAAAVLVRGAEIERAVRELPELMQLDEGDAAALAEYRARFKAERRSMLEAVARLLRARVAAGEIPSWARESAGKVDVCAWCLHIRLEDGVMLPVGHYLPAQSGLRVSHGICHACAAPFRAASV